jgi:hypothetical protein
VTGEIVLPDIAGSVPLENLIAARLAAVAQQLGSE